MEDLAGIGSCRYERVIRELSRVAVGGSLLLIAVDFTDRRIEIHGHCVVAGPSPRRPRPSKDRVEEPIELTDVTEREPGMESLTGERGYVKPGTLGGVMVHVQGDDWLVTPDSEKLDPGQEVEVLAVKGLRLKVRTCDPAGNLKNHKEE